MSLYHITKIENIDGILKNGLIIGKSGGIYLTSDWQDLLQVDVEQRADRIAVFKVTIDDESILIKDEEFDSYDGDWVWYVRHDIPAKNIRLFCRASCTPIGTSVKIKIDKN